MTIKIVETCGACPEAYDVYWDGERVAHYRLRHGCFTVTLENGEVIYSAYPEGDGIFEEDERAFYLSQAWWRLNNILKLTGE